MKVLHAIVAIAALSGCQATESFRDQLYSQVEPRVEKALQAHGRSVIEQMTPVVQAQNEEFTKRVEAGIREFAAQNKDRNVGDVMSDPKTMAEFRAMLREQREQYDRDFNEKIPAAVEEAIAKEQKPFMKEMASKLEGVAQLAGTEPSVGRAVQTIGSQLLVGNWMGALLAGVSVGGAWFARSWWLRRRLKRETSPDEPTAAVA